MMLSLTFLIFSTIQSAMGDTASFMQAVYGVTESEVARFDLNDDGRHEVIIRATAPDRCQSDGCALFVLTSMGDNLQPVLEGAITHVPVRALQNRTNGWRDLAVTVSRPGTALVQQNRLQFDGKRYVSNRAALPADDASLLEGELLLSDVINVPEN